MDNKRLNGENVPEIKQGEIDAWNRGKGDSLRDKLLAESRSLSPARAIAFIKMYAQLGDVHYLATRFDVGIDEARRILRALNINSIEDAKEIVRSGVIAELDDATAESREEREIQRRKDQASAQERHEKQQAALEATRQPKVPEELDAALAARRDEAQRKNKEDRLRQLIAEGLDPATGKTKFRIPVERISAFKRMIPSGVSHLQRQFGGSKADIVNEIKRLAPEYDVHMLRP